MNQLYRELNNRNPEPARELTDFCNGSKTPLAAMANMMMNSPKMKPYADMIKTGASPKDIFFRTAKQMGIDPNTILSQLR